jgi:hypothetical protein
MNHIQWLYSQLKDHGQATQRDYLNHVPESISRNDALLWLYKLEKKRLVMIDYTKKNPVFYLREYTGEYSN